MFGLFKRFACVWDADIRGKTHDSSDHESVDGDPVGAGTEEEPVKTPAGLKDSLLFTKWSRSTQAECFLSGTS